MSNSFYDSRREELYKLFGDLPERNLKISSEKISEEENDHYILEKLFLNLNDIELVPAYFVKPKKSGGRFPAILFNHSHGDYSIGKNELTGADCGYMAKQNYAKQLTQRGYCAICIDMWAFGERRGRTETEIFKEMLWMGQAMWGMMIYDSLRAVDYLVSRPDVDSNRIGTMGMSMGGSMAWWLSALDQRIKVCVEICSLADFHTLIETRSIDGRGIYYYVPGLLKHFTAAQINALIAPRPHLSIAGIYDRLVPEAGLSRIDAELKKVYSEANASDAWVLRRYDTGHFETDIMRRDALAFMNKWL